MKKLTEKQIINKIESLKDNPEKFKKWINENREAIVGGASLVTGMTGKALIESGNPIGIAAGVPLTMSGIAGMILSAQGYMRKTRKLLKELEKTQKKKQLKKVM